jgi:hypothetical protein
MLAAAHTVKPRGQLARGACDFRLQRLPGHSRQVSGSKELSISMNDPTYASPTSARPV